MAKRRSSQQFAVFGLYLPIAPKRKSKRYLHSSVILIPSLRAWEDFQKTVLKRGTIAYGQHTLAYRQRLAPIAPHELQQARLVDLTFVQGTPVPIFSTEHYSQTISAASLLEMVSRSLGMRGNAKFLPVYRFGKFMKETGLCFQKPPKAPKEDEIPF